MKRTGSGSLRGLLWVAPWLIGLSVFYAIPMAMSLLFSLTDYTVIEPPFWIGLDNYRDLFLDPLFWRVVANTLLYAGISIPLTVLVSLGLAALLDSGDGISRWVRLAVFTPTVIPLVAAAMIWLWLFNSDHGLINALLAVLGIEGPNWLQSKGWAMAALIGMSLWSVGQAVIIYIAALRDVPIAQIEAASLDGLGPLRRFIHITIPSITPAILFNSIIQIIAAVQVFATPYIMTGGGPDRTTYFYSHYVYDQAFVYQRMGYASALGWIQTLVLAACIAVLYLAWRPAGSRR